MKTTDQNFIEMCAKVADLTDNNAHTEALQVIAKLFGYTHYIKVFNAIAAIHNAEQCIPLEIYGYRHRKASDMMDLIKRDHGNDIYVKIQESL